MGCDLDQDRINDKTTFILNNLYKLKFLKRLPKEEFNEDFRNVDSAKYALQVSIEAMIDIANHIIARNRLGRLEKSFEGLSTPLITKS